MSFSDDLLAHLGRLSSPCAPNAWTLKDDR